MNMTRILNVTQPCPPSLKEEEGVAPLSSCAVPTKRPRNRGVSLVELLLALAITAILLVATMVAINASFIAYASAAEQASTQAAARMVVHRLLALVRTSTAHGPLEPNPSTDPPVTLTGDTINSFYIELIDPRGNLVRVEYRADDQQLWLITTPPGGQAQPQPLLGGVTNAQFFCLRRTDSQNLLVLERATIDLTIQPDVDTTLALEDGQTAPICVIASTMPRKLEE